MATRYVDFTNGTDSGEALTAETAWKTIEYSLDTADAQDVVICADDTYPAVSDYTLSREIDFSGSGAEQCAWTAPNIPDEVLRISGGMTDTAPRTFTGIAFDASDGTGKLQAVEVSQDSGRDWDLTWNNCWFRTDATSSRGFFLDHRRGNHTWNNCRFLGVRHGLTATGSLATHGAQNITFNKCDITASVSSSFTGIQMNRTSAEVAASTVTIDGLTGTMESSSGACNGIDLRGFSAPTIENCNFTVTGGTTTHLGIYCLGHTSQLTNDLQCNGNTINFPVVNGFGISLGQSSSENYVTASTCNNNTVTGIDPALLTTETPHNYRFGRAVPIDGSGNSTIYGYVGYLFSESTGGTFSGNISRDCQGPHLYAKGCSGGVITNNICYQSDTYDQTLHSSPRCLLAVDEQSVTNTAVTFSNNRAYVSDVDKIWGLAGIAAGQTATFTSNTYYLPSDQGIDLGTALLFADGATTPNATIAQWNVSHPTDTVDATTYTKAQIDAIISGDTQTGTSTGKKGKITIGADGVISATSWTVEQTAEPIEDSVIGTEYRSYNSGLNGYTLSLEGYYNIDDLGQQGLNIGTLVDFDLWPAGENSGEKHYSGDGYVTAFSETASFDGMVQFSSTISGTDILIEDIV